MNKYKQFWEWFLTHEIKFYNDIETKAEIYVPLIDKRLKTIQQDLVFEISELLSDQKREFIISADGMARAFDDVFKLKNAFPGHPRWYITALRQREKNNQHHVEIDSLTLGYEDIFFIEHLSDKGIILDVYIEGYQKDDNRYIHGYFLLLDSLIGEYDAVLTIIDTNILTTPKKKMKPFIALRKIVDEQKTHYASA
ncbi:MAG: hypothetical protein K9L26_03430 [Candidatus Izimaplasma sp.]|nr:hypothetical protein [Candidatus Izimaplasma bacterium]